ncbi:MAG: hypothetical protein J6K42_07775 [Clostridia bacterium]|nr:hypothetical protein [Clostridia bacterium]
MKYCKVGSVDLRMYYNWNMISHEFAIMYFKLEQQGPHSEWTAVNEASVAINSKGIIDAEPKQNNYKKEFEEWIIKEAREKFSKMTEK